jgi:hypothetical protein
VRLVDGLRNTHRGLCTAMLTHGRHGLAREGRGAGYSGDIKTIVDTGLRERGQELGVVGISRP